MWFSRSLSVSSLNDSVCRSFEWFSLVSLSVVVRLQFMVHTGRLVHPAVQLLVQLVR